MKLRAWRKANQISQCEAARRIGVSAAAVCRYEAGERVPDRRVMAVIIAVTGGQVGPGDFYDLPSNGEAA